MGDRTAGRRWRGWDVDCDCQREGEGWKEREIVPKVVPRGRERKREGKGVTGAGKEESQLAGGGEETGGAPRECRSDRDGDEDGERVQMEGDEGRRHR